TRPERDLVAALRSELAAIDPSRPCDRRAEAAGLAAGRPARDGPVARLAVRLVRDGARDARDQGAGTSGTAADTEPLDWDAAPEHCRLAYLRGLFLARGSLSLASGRTHLEFVVPPGDAPLLAARLEQLGLPAASRIRRGRGVVTW